MFGYKPKVTGVATVDIDFYQRIPALGFAGSYSPDFSYALIVGANSSIQSSGTSNISFLVEDPVDFTVSSSGDPTEITIYSTAGSNPSQYLLKKTRKAISATINETTFTFNTPQEFATVTIDDNDIIGILDIVDSDGNEWYEVDYLAQEMVSVDWFVPDASLENAAIDSASLEESLEAASLAVNISDTKQDIVLQRLKAIKTKTLWTSM